MKRLLLAAVLGAVLVMTFAAPAFALRDPFDPVISQSELSGGGGGGGGTQIEPSGGGGTQVQPGPDTGGEVLANTGAETEPWLVAAYGLIAAGAAALVLGKTYHPSR